MVLTGPGTPDPGAAFAPGAGAAGPVAQAVSDTTATIATGRTRFHCNLRRVMDQLWPGMDLDAQPRRVWITDGRLCSAED